MSEFAYSGPKFRNGDGQMAFDVPYPYIIEFKKLTGSTNDDARALAEDGAKDYTLVWALDQTNGHGRLGRAWQSGEGNLYWSAIIHVTDHWPPLETLSFVTALSVAGTVGHYVPSGVDISVKWPNDVLLNGKKVSGALAVGGYDKGWIVVGIGINVNRTPVLAHSLYEATSLKAESDGSEIAVQSVCARLCEEFHTGVERWRACGFDSALRDRYVRALWRKGEEIRVSFDGEKNVGKSGINRGIDAEGYLLLEAADGSIERIHAGDIMPI